MAKRKRKPGGGSKLRPVKDYRSDEYLPYFYRIEAGILQAWAIEPDLRDGDVREALRRLMSLIKKSGQLPPQLGGEPIMATDEPPLLVDTLVLQNLQEIFDEQGPLNAEDLVGVLASVNHSVGSMNLGMRGQNYLHHVQGFMGQLGFDVHQLTSEEVEQMEFYRLPDDDDDLDDDSIEGDYREIKSA